VSYARQSLWLTVPVSVSEMWFNSKLTQLVELQGLWVCGTPSPWSVTGLCWPNSADVSALPHCLSPSLDCFCQTFPKVSVDMTTTPTCCLWLALFVWTPLYLGPVGSKLCSLRLAGNNAAGGRSSRSVTSSFSHPVLPHFDWTFKTFQTISLSSLSGQ